MLITGPHPLTLAFSFSFSLKKPWHYVISVAAVSEEQWDGVREDGGTEKGVGVESEEGEEGVCSDRNKTKDFVTLTWGQPEGWEECHLSPFPSV